jgi:hypothetical protein
MARGSQHSVSASSNSTACELHRKAIEKITCFNRSVSNKPDLYPDWSEVNKIPGTEKNFTLKDYKNELGKLYERIHLYICKRTDVLASNSIPEDDDEELHEVKLMNRCCSLTYSV